MSRGRCECTHRATVHVGTDARCMGIWPTGEKNAAGVELLASCGCVGFVRDTRSWWQRQVAWSTGPTLQERRAKWGKA